MIRPTPETGIVALIIERDGVELSVRLDKAGRDHLRQMLDEPGR